MPKLVLARHSSGRVLHISAVPRGLACECRCLDCDKPLVARKGDVLEHHFGHESGNEHNWAWETHLHAYAKQLIAEAGGLAVPLHAGVTAHLGLPVHDTSGYLRAAGAQPIRQEVSMGSVRPDLVLSLPDRELQIAFEVRVTHACDRTKVEEFKRRRLAALEIDLSRFPPHRFDPARIKEAVLRQTSNKRWLWPLPPVAPRARGPGDLGEFDEPDWQPRMEPPRPEPQGPLPDLPEAATYRFPVRGWKAEVTVTLEPGPDQVSVIVHGLAKGFPSTPLENAAPRIAKLVAEVIEATGQAARELRCGSWIVPRRGAAAVAQALAAQAREYAHRVDVERYSSAEVVRADLQTLRPAWSQPAPRPGPGKPGDNPYARRRG